MIVVESDTGALPIDWDREPLGQMTDRALATLLGCSPKTVQRHRAARGIPRHLKPAAAPPPRPPRARKMSHWDNVPLGQESCATIARRLGVSRQAVHAACRRRGITRAEGEMQ